MEAVAAGGDGRDADAVDGPNASPPSDLLAPNFLPNEKLRSSGNPLLARLPPERQSRGTFRFVDNHHDIALRTHEDGGAPALTTA